MTELKGKRLLLFQAIHKRRTEIDIVKNGLVFGHITSDLDKKKLINIRNEIKKILSEMTFIIRKNRNLDNLIEYQLFGDYYNYY